MPSLLGRRSTSSAATVDISSCPLCRRDEPLRPWKQVFCVLACVGRNQKTFRLKKNASSGNKALLVFEAGDGLLIIWSAKHIHDSRELVPKLSLKVYCMVAHPLQPHLVATGTNIGVILCELYARSLPAIAPLPSPPGSREHSAVYIVERELKLLNFQLSNTANPSLGSASSISETGRSRAGSTEPLIVKQVKKHISTHAPHDSYSILSVSSSRNSAECRFLHCRVQNAVQQSRTLRVSPEPGYQVQQRQTLGEGKRNLQKCCTAASSAEIEGWKVKLTKSSNFH